MAVHNNGTPPVAYHDEPIGMVSAWVHIHIPFSGPHTARWVEPHEGAGYWQGLVTCADGTAIPGWQDEVMWWEDMPPIVIKSERVKSLAEAYNESLRRFRENVEKGSKYRGAVRQKFIFDDDMSKEKD